MKDLEVVDVERALRQPQPLQQPGHVPDLLQLRHTRQGFDRSQAKCLPV